MRIFLSYASEDRATAERINLALAGAGHKVFFDKHSLPAGGDFIQKIRAALARSDVMVFLISPDSVDKSSFALNELQLAEVRWRHPKNRVLPVIVRPTSMDAIPTYLKAVTILEPIGDVSAHLLQSLSSLRPHAQLLRLAAALIGSSVVTGIASILIPVRVFNDVTVVPPRDDAVRMENVIKSSQLVERGSGRLFQSPSRGIDNGYFRLVIPALSEHLTGEDVRLQGGVGLARTFSPNLYFRVQLIPTRNVNTIDLNGCGLSVVYKIRSKALFFYSTESDASPSNIPIDVDYTVSNTFAFRQIGSEVVAYLNDKNLGTFRAQMRPKDCSPSLQLKANPGSEAEAEFQGLSIYEYAPLNVWSMRALLYAPRLHSRR